ncbi:hypothetical protein NC653_037761 [Populus alba x Populus x berolinensis]|uniref:Uncharacterized protein n=1 Tax=Populus alba x Populus x berolinensis TaxID=444605 RepID=A0AAD6PSJ7_9ROSI|nr:hypothetical protein NC653_037761 [Populus alba x Populus x berolinensis]
MASAPFCCCPNRYYSNYSEQGRVEQNRSYGFFTQKEDPLWHTECLEQVRASSIYDLILLISHTYSRRSLSHLLYHNNAKVMNPFNILAESMDKILKKPFKLFGHPIESTANVHTVEGVREGKELHIKQILWLINMESCRFKYSNEWIGHCIINSYKGGVLQIAARFDEVLVAGADELKKCSNSTSYCGITGQQQGDETPMVWEMLFYIYILYSPDWHYRSTMPTFLFLYGAAFAIVHTLNWFQGTLLILCVLCVPRMYKYYIYTKDASASG